MEESESETLILDVSGEKLTSLDLCNKSIQ